MFQMGWFNHQVIAKLFLFDSSSHNHSSVESMGLSNMLFSFHLVGNSPLNHGRKSKG